MPRHYAALAWTAAAATYVLVVLGAVVRITGSGMGCGDDWPLCNGRLVPPLDDPAAVIEWAHRVVAAAVSLLVLALAVVTWRLRHGARSTEQFARGTAAYGALGLLIVQVLLGAVTVKLALPHWTVVLHFATALLLLAAVLAAATGWRPTPGEPGPSRGPPSAAPPPAGAAVLARPGLVALGLGFATVLLGALTAKLGAATACLGFPLCNGQLVPDGNYLQHVHWAHRLFAYGLAVYVAVWAARERHARGPKVILALLGLQVAIAAAMVLGALTAGLRAAHIAVGVAVWAALVLTALADRRAQALSDRPGTFVWTSASR